MARFAIGGPDIAIDLGTANTLVFVAGQGIVLQEPSVIAMDVTTGVVHAVGSDAKRMIGRTPGHDLGEPARCATASSPTSTSPRRCCATSSGACTAAASARRASSCALPPASRRSSSARSRRPAAPPAPARSTSSRSRSPRRSAPALEIEEPAGQMVLDIGGGTSEVAVLSLGGIVVSRAVRVGGYEFDDAVAALPAQRAPPGDRRGQRGGGQARDRLGLADRARGGVRRPRPRPLPPGSPAT